VGLSVSFQVSVGVAALPGASECKLLQERREQRCWKRVTGRGSYTTREALHSQESKSEKIFQGSLKRHDEDFQLQHMVPSLMVMYIELFCDVLNVGGHGYFQVPTYFESGLLTIQM
jgi:hypothetical protein